MNERVGNGLYRTAPSSGEPCRKARKKRYGFTAFPNEKPESAGNLA